MCRLYSSVPWLVVTKIEICRLRNSWSNFSLESLLQIAANVEIIEKRLKNKVNVICSNILRNSYGSLCLESLLQIAQMWKLVDKHTKTRSTQSVMKFENFTFNV